MALVVLEIAAEYANAVSLPEVENSSKNVSPETDAVQLAPEPWTFVPFMQSMPVPLAPSVQPAGALVPVKWSKDAAPSAWAATKRSSRASLCISWLRT
jgi:hypothetical protein